MATDLSVRAQEAVATAQSAVANTFRVDTVDGKGMGALAVREIVVGETICLETPLLKLTPDGAGRYDATYPVYERELARELLSTLDRAAAAPSGGQLLDDVVNTNGIQVVRDEGTFSVTHLLLSRLNHSCLPNSKFEWCDELEQGRIYAIEHINQGHEITFNYGATGSLEERSQFLERFAFRCACCRCEAERSATTNSVPS